MKYPAIYQSTVNGNAIILLSDKQGVVLDKHETVIGTSGGWIESAFKNITAEYLSNTYGEVKSKDHAEFIVKLAEVAKCAGLEVAKHKIANAESFKGIYFNFYTDNETLWFAFHYEIQAKNRGEKQITIPLPPECESVDEWPTVGCTVSLRYRFDSKQVMYTGELLYLSDNHIIIKTENGNDCHCIRSEWDIEKPKTPEQELRDEISDLAFNQFNDDSYDLTHNSYYLAEQLISKYNITKKPQ